MVAILKYYGDKIKQSIRVIVDSIVGNVDEILFTDYSEKIYLCREV